MIQKITQPRSKIPFCFCIWTVLIAFFTSTIGPLPSVFAQPAGIALPGPMLTTTPHYNPMLLKGIQIFPENPLRFDFLIDKGDLGLTGHSLKIESEKMIKFFLSALTIPEKDMWVNLSPFEKDRIISDGMNQTLMGKVLLEQDYVLKQILAALTYPEEALGNEFWQRVYKKSYELYGTTEIPINTFNKVWIIPKRADVFVYPEGAFVVASELDVLSQTDYLASKNSGQHLGAENETIADPFLKGDNETYSKILKEVILPELRKEVNEGKNFAPLRQVYNAIILATWYKRHLKNSLLGKIYVRQGKIDGVHIDDEQMKEKIYNQYLEAFRQGAYNYIREDYDAQQQKLVSRKYFSGGMEFTAFGLEGVDSVYQELPNISALNQMGEISGPFIASTLMSLKVEDGTTVNFPDSRTYTNNHPFKSVVNSSFDTTGKNSKVKSQPKKNSLSKLVKRNIQVLKKYSRTISLWVGLSIGLSLMPGQMKGADFSQDAQGNVIVQVQSGDNLGSIAEQIRLRLKAADTLAYQQSQISGQMWGKDGAVEKLFDGNLSRKIYKGDQFVIPSSLLAQSTVDKLTDEQQDVQIEDSVSIQKSQNIILPKSSPDTVLAKVIPSTIKEKTIISPSSNNSPTEKKQTVSQALSSSSSNNGFRNTVALTILGLFVAFWSIKIISRGKKSEIKHITPASLPQNQNDEIFASGDDKKTYVQPSEENEETSGKASMELNIVTNTPKSVSEAEKKWGEIMTDLASPSRGEAGLPSGIHVEDGKPAAVQPGEEAAAEVFIKNFKTEEGIEKTSVPPAGTTKNTDTKFSLGKSSLRSMDLFGWVLGMSFVIFTNNDPTTLSVAAVTLPFVTRLTYALQILIHENLGHLLPGWKRASAAQRKDILTSKNIFGNLGKRDWLRILLPWSSGPKNNPHVLMSFSGSDQKDIRRLGFIVSTAAFITAFGSTLTLSLLENMSSWIALLGPVTAASLSVMKGSWYSDIVKPEKDGCFACGNSGVFWVSDPQDKQIYPDWVSEALVGSSEGIGGIRRFQVIRGGQSGGTITFGKIKKIVNGKEVFEVIPILSKDLKEKRGPELALEVNNQFKKDIKKAEKTQVLALPGIRGVTGHDRFATGGKVTLEASHPHLSSIEEDEIFEIVDGHWISRPENIFTVITHNGDNDEYLVTKPESGASLAEQYSYQVFGQPMSFADIREFFPALFWAEKTYKFEDKRTKTVWYEALPAGDSPPIAYQILFHLTEGNWLASARYAYVNVMHRSKEEALQERLTRDEQEILAATFKNVFIRHADALIRPQLNDPKKDFEDLWVTPEKLKENPALEFQQKLILLFENNLKQVFVQEMADGTASGRILENWKIRLDNPDEFAQRLEAFISLAVEKFFSGNRVAAVKEFAKRSNGTFGLVVRTSTEPSGVTLYARDQGLTLGFNLGEGLFSFASEHWALLNAKFGDKGRLKSLLLLNPESLGEIANITPDLKRKTISGGEKMNINLEIYSFKENRTLTPEEISKRQFPLNDKNPYYTPLVQYQDPKKITDEDIQHIPSEIKKSQDNWDNPNSFNRLSSEELFQKLVSRYVEKYIKMNSQFYGTIRGTLLNQLYDEAEKCQGEGCKAEELKNRRLILIRHVENDFRIMSYLRARLDSLVAFEADRITQKLLLGEIHEDDLFEEIRNHADIRLKVRVDQEVEKIAQSILGENLDFIKEWAKERTDLLENKDDQSKTRLEQLNNKDFAEVPSLGSGDIDFFIAGYENSLWFSENLKEMLKTFFPKLVVEAASSNKALNLDGKSGIGRRTIALIFSKSGSTFPSRGLIPRLKSIMPDNIFAMTSRVDTLIAMALGQSFLPDDPFIKRIFVTGNFYPAESATVSEVSLFANQIELVLYLVKRMKEVFPESHPWDLNITKKDLQKLAELKDQMLNEAQTVTGWNEAGEKIVSPVHEDLVKNGNEIGKAIAESPIVTWMFRIFVFGIFIVGAPLATIANWSGISVGPGYQDIGSFIIHSLDFLLTITMPFLMTSWIYRTFSGRQRWARMGPPTMVIGDAPFLHQSQENFVSKLGAMSPGSMNMNVHGGNPADHFSARFAHRVVRGLLVIFGIPQDPEIKGEVLRTARQTKGIVNGYFGNLFKGGADVFTIGRGDLQDPDVTNHHVDIGEQDIDDASEVVKKFNNLTFDPFGRLVSYKVLFNTAYRWATTWKILHLSIPIWPGKRLTIAKKTIHIWNQGWTYPSISVHSTAVPTIRGRDLGKFAKVDLDEEGPFPPDSDDAPNGSPQTGTPKNDLPLDSSKVPPATSTDDATNGGIDMNAKWLNIKELKTGEMGVFLGSENMELLPIRGVTPTQIEIRSIPSTSIFLILEKYM